MLVVVASAGNSYQMLRSVRGEVHIDFSSFLGSRVVQRERPGLASGHTLPAYRQARCCPSKGSWMDATLCFSLHYFTDIIMPLFIILLS